VVVRAKPKGNGRFKNYHYRSSLEVAVSLMACMPLSCI